MMMDQKPLLPLCAAERYSLSMSKGRTTTKPRANRVALLRERKGLTQQQLAERAGTIRETIAKIESGGVGLTARWLATLSKALECGQWELLADAPDLTPEDLRLISALKAMDEEGRQRLWKWLEWATGEQGPGRTQ